MTPGGAPPDVFGPLAGDYAAARPGYPDALWAAIDELRPRTPARGVDLAAGAGAATAGFLAHGLRVAAIDSSRAMVARAARCLGHEAAWLGAAVGRAEAIPLHSGTLGLVTVAQAFHWFDADVALGEIARVLVPGGLLAVFWNVTEDDAFVDAVGRLVRAYNTEYGKPVTRSMLETPDALVEHPAFHVERPRVFPHARSMTADRFVAYAFSWSYCGGALALAERSRFERELRELIARHHGEEPWEERLLVAAHFARRR